MNVSLTPELDNFVSEKVQTGMYHSASEVIREGLRLLKEQDQVRQARLDQLRNAVDFGAEQITRGAYTDYTTHNLSSLADEIKMSGRKILASRSGKKA